MRAIIEFCGVSHEYAMPCEAEPCMANGRGCAALVNALAAFDIISLEEADILENIMASEARRELWIEIAR